MYNIHHPHKVEPKVAALFCHSCIYFGVHLWLVIIFPPQGWPRLQPPALGVPGGPLQCGGHAHHEGGSHQRHEQGRRHASTPGCQPRSSWHRGKGRFPVMFDTFHVIRVIKVISFLHHLGFAATKSLGQHRRSDFMFASATRDVLKPLNDVMGLVWSWSSSLSWSKRSS